MITDSIFADKLKIAGDYRNIVYSRDELSAEQLQALDSYWNKFKIDHPIIFEILSIDESCK